MLSKSDKPLVEHVIYIEVVGLANSKFNKEDFDKSMLIMDNITDGHLLWFDEASCITLSLIYNNNQTKAAEPTNMVSI